MGALIISQTPLRVSLFGGGTDLREYCGRHGGAVLSLTIDKFVHVMVKPRWDGDLLVSHRTRERARSIDGIAHGLVRESLRTVNVAGGLEIASMSDAPTEGSGLGASSSFTVGLLNALSACRGETRSPRELAELACRVEIDLVGEPIGMQDQYAAAVGGCNEYRFHQDGTVQILPLHLSPAVERALEAHVVMFYTGRTRRAAEVLTDQRARTEENAGHLHALKDLVAHGRRSLRDGDLEELGGLLHVGWELKKRLSEKVHDDEIDRIYDLGMRAGAYGGKLLGAGAGGFFLFLCPPLSQPALRAALRDYREMPVSLEPSGSRIAFPG